MLKETILHQVYITPACTGRFKRSSTHTRFASTLTNKAKSKKRCPQEDTIPSNVHYFMLTVPDFFVFGYIVLLMLYRSKYGYIITFLLGDKLAQRPCLYAFCISNV